MNLKENTKLRGGKYTIVKVLGQGGFGITYLAKCKERVSGDLGNFQVDVNIAIKEFFVRDDCQRGSDGLTMSVPSEGNVAKVEQFRRKFIKEARSISDLHHPNIIHVSEVFEENGTVYYAMEYLEGGSLRDLVRREGKPLDEERALGYVRQIASALRYMHERRICHFDVKPANIMLDSEGNAILIDFGIAKRYNADGQETTTAPVGISKGYTPPEQYQDMLHDFSPKSDVYSLGATLFFLLTGHVPAESWAVLENGIGPRPDNVSARVWSVICKAMQPISRERYQTMRQLIDAIDGKEESAEQEDTFPDVTVTQGKSPDVFTAEEDDAGTATVTMGKPQAPQPFPPLPPDTKPRRWGKYLIASLACVVAAVLFVALFIGYQRFLKTEQVNGVMLGDGADAMRFTGTLKGGKPQGYGKAVYADGRIYEGCFNNGLREDANAHFVYPSKREFTGTFSADTIQSGRVSSKDGAMYYVGSFCHDTPWNGYWYYTDTDKRCFEVRNGKNIEI